MAVVCYNAVAVEVLLGCQLLGAMTVQQLKVFLDSTKHCEKWRTCRINAEQRAWHVNVLLQLLCCHQIQSHDAVQMTQQPERHSSEVAPPHESRLGA